VGQDEIRRLKTRLVAVYSDSFRTCPGKQQI
jgi:hypothetical protein